MYRTCTDKICKYNSDGECVFDNMGSGNKIDMPCYQEKELTEDKEESEAMHHG